MYSYDNVTLHPHRNVCGWRVTFSQNTLDMDNTKTDCFVISGTFVHSTDENYMVILKEHCIGVYNGKIIFLVRNENLEETLQQFNLPRNKVRKLHSRQFIIPGFVDTHLHAPQYPNAGKGLELGLLDWLEKYTFPTEARFQDLEFAKDAYTKAVSRVLRNGTTTGCYFATIHTDSTLLLCDIINKLGQRAFVGKVNMTQNSPDFYVEDEKSSISETERFIKEVLSRQYSRITPIITPRFAVSCDTGVMKELSGLAKQYNLPIQTHISETKDECKWVGELYPDENNYLDVYDSAGLITNKTVLAHGIYLSEEERTKIKSRDAGLSHCPNSNLSLRSGLLDVVQILDEGISVGLGTDISGGYNPSILDAMRTSVQVSNTLAIQKDSYKPITHREAFMMATLGGSKVMGLADTIGNFEVGKQFDALVIDPSVEETSFDVFDKDTLEDVIQKFIYLGDDRNIIEIYIGGQRIKDI